VGVLLERCSRSPSASATGASCGGDGALAAPPARAYRASWCCRSAAARVSATTPSGETYLQWPAIRPASLLARRRQPARKAPSHSFLSTVALSQSTAAATG